MSGEEETDKLPSGHKGKKQQQWMDREHGSMCIRQSGVHNDVVAMVMMPWGVVVATIPATRCGGRRPGSSGSLAWMRCRRADGSVCVCVLVHVHAYRWPCFKTCPLVYESRQRPTRSASLCFGCYGYADFPSLSLSPCCLSPTKISHMYHENQHNLTRLWSNRLIMSPSRARTTVSRSGDAWRRNPG